LFPFGARRLNARNGTDANLVAGDTDQIFQSVRGTLATVKQIGQVVAQRVRAVELALQRLVGDLEMGDAVIARL